jgi:purine-cytosine permease-like protein
MDLVKTRFKKTRFKKTGIRVTPTGLKVENMMPGQPNHDENLGEAVTYDLAYEIVPENLRRGPVSMGLLWLATQTNFSGMFIGFTAQHAGQSLQGLLIGCGLGTVCLCIYGILAGYLGAVTGQMHPFLTRVVFGKFGSVLVSIFLIVMGSGWYSFQAVYTGQLFQGVFPRFASTTVFAILFTILMATNNVIGFKGIGEFGKFMAPVVFLIAIYSLYEAFATTPQHVIWAAPKIANTTSMIVTATLILGSGVFGNEPDIWRFSRRKFTSVAVPMFLAYALGLFLFPIAGWVMALTSTGSSPAQQAHVIVRYLFGSATFAAIIILLSQVALNDVNLYESINAMTNLFNLKRYYSIAIVLFFGCLLSAWMATAVSQKVFFIVAGIGAATVPTATTLMAVDVLLLPKLFGTRRDVSNVLNWRDLESTNWLGIIALLFGVVVSIVLSIPGNVIPNFGLSIGLAPFEGWLAAVILYLGMIAAVRGRATFHWSIGMRASAAAE